MKRSAAEKAGKKPGYLRLMVDRLDKLDVICALTNAPIGTVIWQLCQSDFVGTQKELGRVFGEAKLSPEVLGESGDEAELEEKIKI